MICRGRKSSTWRTRTSASCWSGPIDWDPLATRFDIFGRYARRRSQDPSDPWQFVNFLV